MDGHLFYLTGVGLETKKRRPEMNEGVVNSDFTASDSNLERRLIKQHTRRTEEINWDLRTDAFYSKLGAGLYTSTRTY